VGNVGAGHAREQKGAGIGAFLVPEPMVARMAASYKALWERAMPANRRESGSAPFWFQSARSPAWRLYALGCSYIKKNRGISPGSLVR